MCLLGSCFIWRFDWLSRQNERVCRSIEDGDKWKDWTRTGRGERLTAALPSFELSRSFPSHSAAKRQHLPEEIYYRGHLDTTQTCSHTKTHSERRVSWTAHTRSDHIIFEHIWHHSVDVRTTSPPTTSHKHEESLPDPDSSSNMLACGLSGLFISKSQNPYPCHACCAII